MGWRISYRHVPRVLNQCADEMCRLALSAEGNVEGTHPGCYPELSPENIDELYKAISGDVTLTQCFVGEVSAPEQASDPVLA
jgi:hypothetical protein